MIKLTPLSEKQVDQRENDMKAEAKQDAEFAFRGFSGGSFRPTKEQLDNVLVSRSLAFILDFIILLALTLGLGLLLAITNIIAAVLTFGLVFVTGIPVFATVALIYHTITIGGSNRGTVGMRIFDVEVRNRDGSGPSKMQAFCHAVLFYFGWAITGPFHLVVSLLTDDRRNLHDILTGTYVVRRTEY